MTGRSGYRRGSFRPRATEWTPPCCDVLRLKNRRIQLSDCYPSGTVILGQLGVLGNLSDVLQQQAAGDRRRHLLRGRVTTHRSRGVLARLSEAPHSLEAAGSGCSTLIPLAQLTRDDSAPGCCRAVNPATHH